MPTTIATRNSSGGTSGAGVSETAIFASTPTDSYGGLSPLEVNDSTATRALIKPTGIQALIPTSATVTAVRVKLWLESSGATACDLRLYKLLVAWGEGAASGGADPGSASWNAPQSPTPLWATAGGNGAADANTTASQSQAIPTNSTGELVTVPSSAALVADAQSWVTAGVAWDGWIMDVSATGVARRFTSSEGADTFRPIIEIDYVVGSVDATVVTARPRLRYGPSRPMNRARPYLRGSAPTTSTLTGAMAEAMALADSQTATGLFGHSQSEALALVDTQATALVTSGAINESLSLVDTQATALVTSDAISESLPLVDTQTATGSFGHSQSEALALADTQSSTATLNTAQPEALTLADTQNTALVAGAAVSEALALADTQTGGLLSLGAIAETLPLADAQDAATTRAGATTEAMALADTQTNTAVLGAAQTEALTLADTQNTALVAGAAVSEALALADTQTGGLLATGATTDALALADTQAAAATLPGSVAEAMVLADTQAAAATFAGSQAESLPLTDVQSAIAAYAVAVSETMTLTDDQTAVVVPAGLVAMSEAMALADTVTATVTMAASISESMILVDTANAGGGKVVVLDTGLPLPATRAKPAKRVKPNYTSLREGANYTFDQPKRGAKATKQIIQVISALAATGFFDHVFNQ